MPSKNPNGRVEVGIALPSTATTGYAAAAYNATLYPGTAIPSSRGRFCTFIIGAASLTSVTRIGFSVQGTNDDLSGSPSWSNCAPHALVQSGRFPSISPTILGIAAGSARTPPDGAALTTEQQAIEARRLVRFAANKFLAFTFEIARTGYKHHRLVCNEVVGAAAPIFATYFKSHLEEALGSHPYDVANPIVRRPAGFTDAQWAQYLDQGVIPSAVTDVQALLDLNIFQEPIRPTGLSDAQWEALRNSVVDDGFALQHRPDGV